MAPYDLFVLPSLSVHSLLKEVETMSSHNYLVFYFRAYEVVY